MFSVNHLELLLVLQNNSSHSTLIEWDSISRPRVLALRRLPRMHEVVGSNPTEGKICFAHFTLF